MEKLKSPVKTRQILKSMVSSFNSLHLNSTNSPALHVKKTKVPSLVNLCIGVIGKNLEDLIPNLGDIAPCFPANIKMAIAAIARRRKLLTDEVLISLADETWEILDLSGSDVSDIGLTKLAEMCSFLRAVDISRCRNITPDGVFQLVQLCPSLETLRCGGCPRSDFTARRSLGLFRPNLNNVEGDSWEELDATEITYIGESVRWIVWPKIDPVILENFSSECPRIRINPQVSPCGFNAAIIPREALPDIALDDSAVEDIDPSTWASYGVPARIPTQPLSSPNDIPMAEKFRLAFVERDTRLAPKRAKNARQHQRRAEKEWRTQSVEGKVISLASQASKTLRGWN